MKPLFILLLLAFAAFGQQITVAVLPSDGNTFSNDELEALTDKMREAALKVLPTDAFILLKQDVVVKRLGGAENYIKECKESSCIVNLGKKAQVDYVAQASVGKLGGKMRVKVELYNVSTEGLIGIFNEYFDNFFSLLNAIDKRVPDLFKKISDVSVRKSFTDVRDGREYKMVVIGKQTWMAENLNYAAKGSKCGGTDPDLKTKQDYFLDTLFASIGIFFKKDTFYILDDKNTKNCERYGRLYNWNSAMKSCPKGWHLPSDTEWRQLIDFVGDNDWKARCTSNSAGYKLKAKIGWNYDDIDCDTFGDGTDVYGFSAIPGGFGNEKGSFYGAGKVGHWWTSKEKPPYALGLAIGTNGYVSLFNAHYKMLFLSVRCLQD